MPIMVSHKGKSDRLGMLLGDRHGCYYVIGMNVIERSPCVGIRRLLYAYGSVVRDSNGTLIMQPVNSCVKRGLSLPVHGFNLNIQGIPVLAGLGDDDGANFLVRNDFESLGNIAIADREHSLYALYREYFSYDLYENLVESSVADGSFASSSSQLMSPTTGWQSRYLTMTSTYSDTIKQPAPQNEAFFHTARFTDQLGQGIVSVDYFNYAEPLPGNSRFGVICMRN